MNTAGSVLPSATEQQAASGMNRALLYYLLIAEGAVSIALEILAMRQVVPHVGSNIIVTSSIISGFLASLALGYAKGGKVRENYTRTLAHNLLITQAILVVGLSSYFLAALNLVTHSDGSFLALFIFLVVCPATYLIGQTVPILSNFLKSETQGELSGRILFLSTIGSCTGSLFTAAILMNYIGINNTITTVSFVTTTIVAVLVASTATLSIRYFTLSIVISLLSLTVINGTMIGPSSQSTIKLFSQLGLSHLYQNSYSTVSTYVTDDGVRKLNVNNSLSSSYDPLKDASDLEYAVYIEEKLQRFDENLEVLVIGAGGFTLGISDKTNNYHFIDIDPDLKNASEEHLLGKPINGSFVAKDARSFLSNTSDLYDVIIGDAFTNASSIPPALVTSEYFSSVADSLSEDGTAFFNVIMSKERDTAFAHHVTDTIHSVFNCLSTDVSPSSQHHKTNIVFTCKPRKHSYRTYTDDSTNLFELAQ